MARQPGADLSRPRDRPEARVPGAGDGHDLRGRLAELPGNHPSAADYRAGREPQRRTAAGTDGSRAGPSERLPAADRPDRTEPLARGPVERVGRGIVDERASQFQPRERRLADYLAGEGRAVVAIHHGYGRDGRKPDAAVDGVRTEFKSLDFGASHRTVKCALTSGKGQASEVVIDGRQSGLGREEADRGLRRFLGAPHADRVQAIRIVGDDYDLAWKRG
jgi:hypothetical protein